MAKRRTLTQTPIGGTIFDVTDEVAGGVADVKEPYNRWGWGSKIYKMDKAQRTAAVDAMVASGTATPLWGWSIFLCIYYIGTGLLGFIFGTQANRSGFDFYNALFDGSAGVPVPGQEFEFPLQWVLPVGAILTGVWYMVVAVRGKKYVADRLIDHAAGWMIWAPFITMSLFQAYAVLIYVFLRTTSIFFIVTFALAIIGALYLMIDEQVAKEHTWMSISLGLWLITTVLNIGIWALILTYWIRHFDDIKNWEHASVFFYVLFGVGQWLLVTLYLFAESLNVPRLPKEYHIYVWSWTVLLFAQSLIIYWLYLIFELFL